MAGAGVPLASLFFGRQQWFPPTKLEDLAPGLFNSIFKESVISGGPFGWNPPASSCDQMATQLWTWPTDPHIYRQRCVVTSCAKLSGQRH